MSFIKVSTTLACERKKNGPNQFTTKLNLRKFTCSLTPSSMAAPLALAAAVAIGSWQSNTPTFSNNNSSVISVWIQSALKKLSQATSSSKSCCDKHQADLLATMPQNTNKGTFWVFARKRSLQNLRPALESMALSMITSFKRKMTSANPGLWRKSLCQQRSIRYFKLGKQVAGIIGRLCCNGR